MDKVLLWMAEVGRGRSSDDNTYQAVTSLITLVAEALQVVLGDVHTLRFIVPLATSSFHLIAAKFISAIQGIMSWPEGRSSQVKVKAGAVLKLLLSPITTT